MVLALNNMDDINLENQRVLIRQDLNVPIKNGVITSTKRIDAALPTIVQALDKGASVMLMSHLGRPVEGGTREDNDAFSLAPVAAYIGQALDRPVPLITDYLAHPVTVGKGEIVLFENIRFNKGEKANDDGLSKAYAELCDIYVMDAFGTAHRAQASTHGVAKYAPIACAGPLMMAELNALESALETPARPVIAIVGGSKVSTKLTVLETLANTCDQIIVGGGIANTFLAAAGKPVGRSLYEPDLIAKARAIMDRVEIPLPSDVVTGKSLSETAIAELKSVDNVNDDDMIFDIGPQTSERFGQMIEKAKTIIWNGPVGVFEMEQFSTGTAKLASAIADSQAFSIAGGGDTLAAVEQFGIADKVSYISTGGGAFLEYVEGKELPAVAILKTRINKV